MTLVEFNQHCLKASLPEVDADQWECFISTRQGRIIADQHDSPSASFIPGMELIVRSVSPLARSRVESLGYRYDAQHVLDLAQKENKKLFAALHRVQDDPEARRYIASLGFTKAEKIAVEPPYYSFHVYASKGALCFSEAQTRKQNRHTINIEGALVLGSSTQYDWKNKLIVQLTPEELFLVLAVLNGRLDKIQFSGHGVSHDKLIEIHRQETSYFFRLVQKGRSPVSVPVLPTQALNLTSLLFQQIQRNHPHLGIEQMRLMEDQLVRMYGDTKSVAKTIPALRQGS